jgi:hypothetical protein
MLRRRRDAIVIAVRAPDTIAGHPVAIVAAVLIAAVKSGSCWASSSLVSASIATPFASGAAKAASANWHWRFATTTSRSST